MCGTSPHTAHGPTRRARIRTPGPGLVGHNVLHVHRTPNNRKDPHDIMTNINIVFLLSFHDIKGKYPDANDI